MRQPPMAGPSAVEWIAMIARKPLVHSVAKTTCSCWAKSAASKTVIGL
jgi:hypothetical protein